VFGFIANMHINRSSIKVLLYCAFDWNGEKKKDWMHSLHQAGGMDLHTFKASPGATFEVHKASGEWLGVVVAGSGTLLIGDDAGKIRQEIPISNGDVFVFKSDTMHGWLAGPEGMSTVFIVMSKHLAVSDVKAWTADPVAALK